MNIINNIIKNKLLLKNYKKRHNNFKLINVKLFYLDKIEYDFDKTRKFALHWKRSLKNYNNNPYLTFSEDSDGNWNITEVNNKGKKIYYEDHTGFWKKTEYNYIGKLIYTEDSKGNVYDNR